MKPKLYCILFVVCTSVQIVCAINQLLSNHTLIYVDKNSAVKDSSCWTGGLTKPCHSLALALEGVQNLSASPSIKLRPWIFLEPGNYTIEKKDTLSFSGPLIADFGLIANDSNDTQPPAVSINCASPDAGFKFSNITKITFQNVWIKGCSAVQPSTSRKSDTHFWEFRIGLYFVLCKDITFEHVWVSETQGIATFVYSSYGNNVFHSCHFFNNRVAAQDSTIYPAGGGLYIEFSSCIPHNNHTCTPLEVSEYASSEYLISHTGFDHNFANVSNSVMNNDFWLLPVGYNHSSIGRGGGLSIVFKGYSQNIAVSVDNASFNDNIALWGGGMFVEFHDNSADNSLNVSGVTFSQNKVLSNIFFSNGTGGGGVRLGYIFYDPSHVSNNSILFNRCTFARNEAYWGGGLSFYTTREQHVTVPSNSLEFNQCSWFNNSAWVGAAIDLTVWQASHQGLPVTVKFTDLTVSIHGYDSNLQSDRALLGVGALYTDSIPVQFYGSAEFSQNYRTALVAVAAPIQFMKDSNIAFDNNQGRNGGAIALLGNSFLQASRYTGLAFFGNVAQLKGGAIYSETLSKHDLITTPNCFVRYEDILVPPSSWESFFFFQDNKASGKDNSIYTTTTVPCEWKDSNTNQSPGSNGTAFCWDNWLYLSNGVKLANCTSQIQTDPKKLYNTSNSVPLVTPLLIYPGEKVVLSKQMYGMSDDMGNDATERMVLIASVQGNASDVAKATTPLYISDNTISLYGTPDYYLIDLYTIDPRVVFIKVPVELLHCPFGFTESNKTKRCICDSSQPLFTGIVQCSSSSYNSSLALLGQWAGVNNDTGNRVAGYCPYTESLSNEQLTFPDKVEYPGDYFCSNAQRTGRLCGGCKNGSAPALNSDSYMCVKCPPNRGSYSWVFYLLTEILPLTLFFIVLVVFNVSLTSATANAFIFFSQTISATFSIYNVNSSPYSILRSVYLAIYGIWNLDILNVVPFFQYCLHPEMKTISLIALEYVIAIYPLVLIVVIYGFVAAYNYDVRPVTWLCRPVYHCSIRIRNSWNPKNSLIDAIAAFLLLSYTKLILTSIKLLRYTHLYDKEGTQPESTVVYYDGTMNAYTGEHIGYVFVAVFVLIVFVTLPPLVLILFPMKFFHTSVNVIFRGCCQLSGGKLELFLNAFYGCFKDGTQDGTRDYRVFAGLYFLARAFFALIQFIPVWQTLYLVQDVFCVIAFLSFASLRPYRNDFYNVLDAGMFALLLLISLFNQYNFNQLHFNEESTISAIVFVLEYALIWIPMFYISWCLIRWLCGKYRKKVYKQFMNSHMASYSFPGKRNTVLNTSDNVPTSTGLEDDNSIIKLIDERPRMYDYGGIKQSGAILNTDTAGSQPGNSGSSAGGKSDSNRSSSGASGSDRFYTPGRVSHYVSTDTGSTQDDNY